MFLIQTSEILILMKEGIVYVGNINGEPCAPSGLGAPTLKIYLKKFMKNN
jgi:hypothetical protein